MVGLSEERQKASGYVLNATRTELNLFAETLEQEKAELDRVVAEYEEKKTDLECVVGIQQEKEVEFARGVAEYERKAKLDHTCSSSEAGRSVSKELVSGRGVSVNGGMFCVV